MKKLGVTSKELFAAEDESDKSLEQKKAEMQRESAELGAEAQVTTLSRRRARLPRRTAALNEFSRPTG
jgi:hypothetical protein